MRDILMRKAARAVFKAAIDFVSGRSRAIQGMAAVEFAVIGPALVLMMICASDLGIGVYRHMQVQNAAQLGAEYAVAHGFDASAISTAVSAGSSFPSLSVSPAPTQYCGCPTSSGITTTDCASSCPGGGTPGTYVTVSTQGTYTTVLRYPLIPDSFTFSNQATVRIQ